MSQLGWLLLMLLCVRLSITCLPSNVPPLQHDFYPRLTVLQSGRPFLGSFYLPSQPQGWMTTKTMWRTGRGVCLLLL